MLKYALWLSVMFFFAPACSSGDDPGEGGKEPEIPIVPPGDKPGGTSDKRIQMWVDAHANFGRFADKANITQYLDKMKETGFNEIYLDVKPGIGYALYKSDILPPLTRWDNETVERDWDYLAYWIDEAERRDISVIASISTLGFGYTKARQGLVYDNNAWDGKTQAIKLTNSATIVDVRDRTDVDAAMLNPVVPEVQALVLAIVGEILTKYPKLKGICLDYCRWSNNDGGWYGFEDATIAAFETYAGVKVPNRNDIITATGGMGPLFSRWIEFRSMTIANLVAAIRNKVKSVNPDAELHLWASAHWDSRYGVAQNWASKKYVVNKSNIYTENYAKTGFADQLDAFSLGAYADAVWRSENPGNAWSVENFVTTYSKYTMGDCKVYGSIASYAYGGNPKAVSDAVYLCLKNTDGVMVFELSHVSNNDQWAAIKTGIERVINNEQ